MCSVSAGSQGSLSELMSSARGPPLIKKVACERDGQWAGPVEDQVGLVHCD